MNLDVLREPERIVELLCEAAPTWKPGRRLAYHAVTGGFILGEIVRRVTGRDLRAYLDETVLRPLGFRGMNYGAPPELRPHVARNAFTGREVPFPLSRIVRRALGVSFRDAVSISNDARWLDAIVPAGNICATANEASRFYQLLLREGELDGVRVFNPRTVRRARTESSYLEADLTLGLPIRYGLGFMLGADYLSLYGPRTPSAFGHLGFIQILTWADPERQIAVGLLTSGKPFLGLHLRRLYGVLAAISRSCPPV
jgi:CubicO group peptidase (beta-lactamase class C family)